MSATLEDIDFDSSEEESIIRRRQLRYITTLADVADFAGLNGAEVFPAEDTLRSIAKIADGGIVFNKKLYMLPHTAAIACQAVYSERWKPVDGWKFWNVIKDGESLSLERLREDLLDARMRHGDTVAD